VGFEKNQVSRGCHVTTGEKAKGSRGTERPVNLGSCARTRRLGTLEVGTNKLRKKALGGTMQFGIFDQNDHGRYPLAEQYENRLRLIEFYDRVGFRTYHMSEHHATPLNLTPSPSVFLAAIAQRTTRLRFGALVYVLPAHHPLRLAEEVCMLDHLSCGRVEVGIGRGASPHELNYFGVDADAAPAMYVEAYQVMMQALTRDEVNFAGKHYQFSKVPIEAKPQQRPHPPLWYAVPVPEGAAWPAQNGINVVCGGPVARVREIAERYRAEWAAAGNALAELPLVGINRFVLAADSDQKAMVLGRRAWPIFYKSFMKLWKLHGTQPRFARLPEDFDTLVQNGGAIAGSPATLRDQVRSMMEAAGTNYFIGQFSFGDLSHEEVLHSAGIFAREVLPMAHERTTAV
jgi:alkanesulfonate monooxygenase SsuD/methylene tetrahydromethanopterin reductase-like flavin-dependent oxidoreductase (luciferase family)